MFGWLSLIVAVLAGLFVLIQSQSGALSSESTAVSAAGVLVLLAAMYFATHNSRWNDGHPSRIMAAVVLLATLAGAAWWLGADRITASLRDASSIAREPPAAGRAGPVSVLIRRDGNGKFTAQGQINGVSAPLLIDTGATAVMLRSTDAEKAGIDLNGLSFTTAVQTANGTVYAAPIRVRTIALGLLRLDDVEALVAKPGSLNENLLGISFLRRLASYELKGDFLTLRE